MINVGDWVKWCEPLDADYSYGAVLEIKRGFATVVGSGYHAGRVASVHLSYMEKVKRGGSDYGGSKEYSK